MTDILLDNVTDNLQENTSTSPVPGKDMISKIEESLDTFQSFLNWTDGSCMMDSLGVLTTTPHSLSCYVCDSDEDSRCLDAVPDDDLFLKNCSLSDNICVYYITVFEARKYFPSKNHEIKT